MRVESARRLAVLCSALGLGLIAAPACTSVTNTTAVQCTSEAECLSLGPEFAGTTCDKVTKTCVKTPDNVGNCTTNQECIDRIAGGAAICRRSDKKCVNLITPECPNIFTKAGNSELADDNVVVLGSLMPGPNIELGIVFERAVELAQYEISSNPDFHGLPPVPGSTKPRPLAILACREFGAGREGAVRAARFLADEVQVPLTIGPINPVNAATLASQIFFPKRILNILPVAPSNSLANLAGNPIAPTPLLWRTFYDDRAQARVAAEFVQKQLEPLLTAKGVTPPFKVAVLASGDLLGQSMAQTMIEVLKFNGVSAAENQAAGNLISLNVGDFDDPVNNPNPDAKIGQALGQVFQFKPNIVLHMYTPTAISKVFFGMEGGWPAGVPRAYHVGGSAVWNNFGPLFPFLGAQPFRSGRMFGIQNYIDPRGITPPYPITSPQVQTFAARFTERNPEFAGSVAITSQLTFAVYDSTYLAAYAVAALRDKPLTGDNAAQLLNFFNPPGVTVNTYDGPTGDTSKAFAELGAGRAIDLQGLFGAMTFDVARAAPTYGLEITCPNVQGGRIVGMKGTGFHYVDASQKAVLTTNTAPPGQAPVLVEAEATAPIQGCPPPPP